jgi:hypothetical protein
MLREGPGGSKRIVATLIDPGGMELGAPGPDPIGGNPLLHGEGEGRSEQRSIEIELK